MKSQSHTRRRRSSLCWIYFATNALLLFTFAAVSATPTPSSGLVLRVRLEDGSMERIKVPPGAEETMTLGEALLSVAPNIAELVIKSTDQMHDKSKTLNELGLKNGSLLTLSSPKKASSKTLQKATTIRQSRTDRWDPYPDLAKDYHSAVLKAKSKRSGAKSYGDLAQIQSEMHIVEPQPEGPIKRVYMCHVAAERFQSNSLKEAKVTNRVALLLGTIQRERVNSKPKHRTSLSSQTEDEEFCNAIRVHALWEPPQNSLSEKYDAEKMLEFPKTCPNVLRVASRIGLQPVGWIFTYADERSKDTDGLPVFSQDVVTGGKLQIHNMQRAGREDGARFVTLAMEGGTGATEAFQLSDVAVQMVAEEMFANPGGRHVAMKHSVFVDGRETKDLDSVLCLVNTAMLSHKGSFSGASKASSVKKNGSLSNKTRKKILKGIDEPKADDVDLLEILCDFDTLLALDAVLEEKESELLCSTVRKFARGQKRGTVLDAKLKKRIKSLLDH